MRKTTFIFAGIISAIIGTAYAVGENTVTSKSYVDAMDATKQGIIPATGTNASTPGTTVVTYTGTAGTIGERGIYHSGSFFGNMDDLTTVAGVYNVISDLPQPGAVQRVCVNPPSCTLWELRDITVLSPSPDFCNDDDECPDGGQCVNNFCE